MATDITKDQPNTLSPAYERMQARWDKCRALMKGTDAIHDGRTRFLPKHPREELKDYDRRATGTELYNAYARTISAMVGYVFQRDPVLGEDVPEIVQEDWEDIDGAGTSGAMFARRLFEDALSVGLSGVLIDYPTLPDPEQLSLMDERVAGARPYWTHYSAEQIISGRVEIKGGQTFLRQLVLKEDVEKDDGLFGTVCETQYRVLTKTDGRVAYSVWVEDKTKKGTYNPDPTQAGFITGVEEIPFVFLLTGRVDGWNECAPPLMDLADLNLAHYRVSADRRHVMHISCVPIPVRKGYRAPVEGAVEAVGPNILQDLPADGSFAWAEISGTAFAPTKDELEAIERRMASIGLAFLEGQSRVAQTAESHRISSSAQNASLATAAKRLGDALEKCFAFHAKYRKVEAGSISLNTDFEKVVLDSGMIQTLSSLNTAGQISLETLWDLLVNGSVLPPEFDKDEEQKRILEAEAVAMQKMIDTQQLMQKEGDDPPADDDAKKDPPLGEA